ncbi:class I SAM-dependent methyltransferase [Candidatus Pelagibacter ubique]|nr:class I SAM-dependent methyltransferase [Candidatus Pelagibacter ubique]
MIKDDYLIKLEETTLDYLKSVTEPVILEFGVRYGQSTQLFLEICEKNNGFLYSVDVDDTSKKFNSKKWKFIHGRDDNFELIESYIPKKIDLIYIDSFHDAEHVAKIFFHYYPFLKDNGQLIIDDISWLIYSKKNERDNFNSEINNQETFNKILDIYNNNAKNFNLTFNFRGSGIAKIIKINNETLNKPKKILSRKFSFKNFIRKIARSFS